MTISLHSHSGQFCAHAKGTLEEVVQQAIAKGFTTFGLSEHIPRYRIQDLYPEEEAEGVEALATKFEAYLVEAHRLKDKYKNEIDLLVGIETEYINHHGLDQLEKLLAQHGSKIEYLVGSLHHCHEHAIDFDKPRFDAALALSSSSDPNERFTALFETYFDNQLLLLQRFRPAVIGHFDLCRLYYPELDFRSFPSVWERIQRNVAFGQEYGALFEINASAFRKGWSTAYPGVEVFDLILEKGGRFTLSDDSHGPLAVGLHYDKAYGYLRERKVQRLWLLARNPLGILAPKVIDGQPWLDLWTSN